MHVAAYFLAMLFTKKDIDAMISLLVACILLWMSPSWKPKHFFPPILLFRGRLARQEEQNWTKLNWLSISEIHVEPRQPEHVFPTTEHHEDAYEHR